MTTKFYSPSINIVRDQDHNLEYIPTRNGEAAFNQIINSYDNGVKAFCLIGAYGTGKSAFLLAFDKVINGKTDYYEFTDVKKRKTTSKLLIGNYTSFEENIKETFNISEEQDTILALKEILISYEKENKRLLIVVDEFGKHLEYAAHNDAEEEMYFFQKLAELINSKENDAILLTTLHQPIEGYANNLNKTQKEEWKKVSGRYINIPFNEPVEQLLFLAAKHIENLDIEYSGNKEAFKTLFQRIQESKAFPLKDYFSLEFAEKLFPFDLLSASTLILAFQAYGQNERSLFNFLKADDYLGLQDSETSEFFALPQVYDYLSHNFNSSIVDKYNPHKTHWGALRDAISTAESLFDEELFDILKILKTVGLLNIFGKPGQRVDLEFLSTYCSITLNIKNSKELIELLERRQLIRYQSFNSKYVLFKGTDFDISQALVEAENTVQRDFNFLNKLTSYFSFPILQAKKAFYEKGTPRYFEYKITESYAKHDTTDSIDGYIQLIINDEISEEKLIKATAEEPTPLLLGWLKNSDQIKETIYEIEKIKWVKEQAKDDSVVQNELNENESVLIESLNEQFTSGFYGDTSNVNWYCNGETINLKSSRDLNKQLSIICDNIYSRVPIFKNESINRQRPQGTISSARRTLIKHLLEEVENEDLGFSAERFPPEKTIYQSLIKETGIHRLKNGKYELSEPTDQSFSILWNTCNLFIDGCSESPRKLSDLISILKLKPFGLKQGFIEIWIPLFLIIKNKDFAFFEDNTFIPELQEGTLDIVMSKPHNYFIHTFKLSTEKTRLFNQYRYFLNQIETEVATRETFIETVKPFLSFYKRLSPFAQTTTSQISNQANLLRTAIKNASDPEKLFFEDIPRALKYSAKDLSDNEQIEKFAIKLKEATRELNGAQGKLLNTIETIINKEIGSSSLSFPENKELLQARYKKIKTNKLNTKQKVFFQRITTALDDRSSWISSLAFAIVNKTLDNFTDKDIELFRSYYPSRIHELDNLSEISNKDVDQDKEEVLKLEITSFVKGVQNKLIRLPKSKSKGLEKLENQIKPILNTGNKQENIAILIKLLQEEIDNE